MDQLSSELLKKYLDPFDIGSPTLPNTDSSVTFVMNLASMFKNAVIVGLPIEPLLEVLGDLIRNDNLTVDERDDMLKQFMNCLVKDIRLAEFQSQMIGNTNSDLWQIFSQIIRFLLKKGFPDPAMKAEE